MKNGYRLPRSVRTLGLIVALFPASVACGSKHSTSHNATAPTEAAISTPRATPTPSPQNLMDAAIRNTDALKTFHFTLTHENGTTPIAQGISMKKADGDFQRPDRLRATVSGTVQQGFAVDAKVISVGDSVWIAVVGNKYLPLQNGVGASTILDPNNGVLKALRGVKNPTYAGTDKINGADMTIVSGTIDAGDLVAIDSEAQAGKPVNGKVWIGKSDQRVYRIRMEGPLNDGEPANIARQIDLSQFDASLDIQPPA